MSYKYFAPILVLLILSLGGVRLVDAREETIRTWPIDVLLDRLVLLRDNKAVQRASSTNELKPIDQNLGQDLDLSLLDDPQRLVSFLHLELLDEEKLAYFLVWVNNADPVARWHTKDLQTGIRQTLLAEKLHTDSSKVSRSAEFPRLLEQVLSKLDPIKVSDSYQYAYGRELERKIIKNFEAIHRQTFYENKIHNVDIGVDFLEPLKAILKTLKLGEKFEWIFENILHIGYKSSFKHHKKVFMRFKGYYAKISISFELMRRKRYWWGYGNWEVAGTASKVVEEPMAVIGTNVKELEPSQN